MATVDWSNASFDEVYELIPGRAYTLVIDGQNFRLQILDTLFGAPYKFRAEIEERLVGESRQESWVQVADRPRSSDRAKSLEDALSRALDDLKNFVSERDFKASRG